MQILLVEFINLAGFTKIEDKGMKIDKRNGNTLEK
jgi:hypothetical protein